MSKLNVGRGSFQSWATKERLPLAVLAALGDFAAFEKAVQDAPSIEYLELEKAECIKEETKNYHRAKDDIDSRFRFRNISIPEQPGSLVYYFLDYRSDVSRPERPKSLEVLKSFSKMRVSFGE